MKKTTAEPPAGPEAALWRACAWVECGARFRLDGAGQTDRPGFRAFCSDDCALKSAARRLGLTGVTEAVQARQEARERSREERRARARAVPVEERRARMTAIREQGRERLTPAEAAANDEHLTARWGPVREVVRVLVLKEKSKRVVLSCGHETTTAAHQQRWRCGRCRGGEAVSSAKKSAQAKKPPRGIKKQRGGRRK